MTHISAIDVRSRIEQELMAEGFEAVQKQAEIIDQLLTVPCRRLQYGGRPQVIAEQLDAILEQF